MQSKATCWRRAALGVLLLAPGGCASALVSATFLHPAHDPGPVALPPGVDELRLDIGDGVRVRAFHLPRPDTRRLVVCLHGNAGHAAHRLPLVAQLAALGTSVLLVEYPGYGASDGAPSEAGCYAAARAALALAAAELGHSPERTVLLGRSLGAAVALEAAQDAPLAGLILVTPFTSGRDMASALGYGWLGWLLGHPFDSAARITRVRAPVMVIHGDADDLIPVEQGRRLFAAAPRGHALHVVAGGHHNDLTAAGDDYWRWIRDFLDAVAPVG